MASSVPTVAILDWFQTAPFEEELLRGIANVRCFNLGAGDEIPASIADCAAVIRFRAPAITRRELAKMSSAKVFICASVGYDRVDLAAAADLGIPVVHLPT
jgi:phosphoglycerate dehydrogenase-like enzyme